MSKKETYKLVNTNANEKLGFPLRPTELPYMRATSLAVMETCPKQWAAQFLLGMGKDEPTEWSKIPSKPTASQIGTACHVILEEHVRAKEKGEFADPRAHPAIGWVPESEQANLINYIYDPNRLYAEAEEDELIALEFSAKVDWPEGPMFGAPPLSLHIDKLSKKKNDKTVMVITDYKTNREWEPVEVWQQKMQQLAYSYAVRREFPDVTKVIWRIGYVNHDSDVTWVSHPSDDQVFLERVTTAWFNVLNVPQASPADISNFPEKLHKHCGYCPLKASCATFKASTETFELSMATMLPVTKVDRYEKLKVIQKLVKQELEEAEATLVQDIMLHQEAGKKFIVNGTEYRLETGSRRKADFMPFWAAVCEICTLFPEFWDEFDKIADDVITVKVGGLDKLAKLGHAVSSRLAPIINSVDNKEPTLKTVKSK